MLVKSGRFLQLLGLVIAPLGIVGNIMNPQEVTEGRMLMSLGIGLAVFGLGWLLQQAGRPR